MSYSEHRPGKFGSDGQIEFDVSNPADDEPLYLQDLRDAEERARQRFMSDDASRTTPLATGPVGRVTGPIRNATGNVLAPTESDATQTAVLDAPREFDDLDVLADFAPTERTSTPERTDNQLTTPLFDSLAPEPVAEPAPEPEAASEPEAAPATRRSERPRQQRRPWRRMAILGGADSLVLDHVPSETGRFIQMFFVLLGTALISGISMVFALTTGVKLIAWLAVPLAFIWALIIFNLDRFLTSTMKSSTRIGKLIALALPRVIMAAIIGVVVAEPLVLQVFANDIAREVNATNIVQSQNDQSTLDTGPEKQALDAASQRLSDLENQAATGVVSGTTTDSATLVAAQQKVDGINAQMQTQQGVINDARAIYQCELTGQGASDTAGCTGIAGEGSSSEAAKSQLDEAQATYDSLAAELRAANDELAAAQAASATATSSNEDRNREEAKNQLPAAQASYDTALAAYNARAEAIASGNSGASGLLSQMTALNRLAEKEPMLGIAHWLIAALFFMIELLPVLVKVLTSYGPPSLYEQTAAARRQVEHDRITAQAFRDRAEIATGTTVAAR